MNETRNNNNNRTKLKPEEVITRVYGFCRYYIHNIITVIMARQSFVFSGDITFDRQKAKSHLRFFS